jgi:hypothetical protein
MLKLVLKQKSDDVLWLTLSGGFRSIFVFISLFLAFFMAADMIHGGKDSGLAPLIFLCTCLLAACYCEKWVFDLKQKRVEKQFGLVFLCKRKFIPLAEIQYFTSSHFVRCKPEMLNDVPKKGPFQKDYAALSLVTMNGKVKNLEIARGRHKGELVKKAQQIAAFCSKPFQ